MIRPKEVTLVSKTQPSGPLCLWQCLHYCRQRADLQRLQGKVQQGVNKNISTFGPYLAVQLDKPGQEFSLLTAIVEDDSVILNIVMEFNIEGKALIWKLWKKTVMVGKGLKVVTIEIIEMVTMIIVTTFKRCNNLNML